MWVYDDRRRGHLPPRHRADPDARYAAEYDGEELHTSDEDQEHDEERRDWCETRARLAVRDLHARPMSTTAARIRATAGRAGSRRATQSARLWTPYGRRTNQNPPVGASGAHQNPLGDVRRTPEPPLGRRTRPGARRRAWSRNQVRFAAVMPRAGVSWTDALGGEGAGDGVGLALAGDQEPHLAGAVEGGEGQRDALGRRLGGVGDGYGDPVVDVELREAGEQRRDVTVGAHARAARGRSRRLRWPAPACSYAAAAASRSGWTVVGRRHRVHPGRVDTDHVEQVAARPHRSLRSSESAGT